MTEAIIPPIVISERGDLYIAASAERPGVESYDAFDFEYFDSKGKRLSAVVDGWQVSLVLDENKPADPEQLLHLIQTYADRFMAQGRLVDSDRKLLEQIKQSHTLELSISALARFLETRTLASRLRGLLRRKDR